MLHFGKSELLSSLHRTANDKLVAGRQTVYTKRPARNCVGFIVLCAVGVSLRRVLRAGVAQIKFTTRLEAELVVTTVAPGKESGSLVSYYQGLARL